MRSNKLHYIWCASAIAILFTAAGCLETTPASNGGTAASPEQHAVIEVSIDAIPCPPGYDNGQDDNVCLAYNGQIPGPTWVFEEGDSVTVALTNNVSAGLEAMEIDGDLRDRLGSARYTLHRHGVAQDACSDGVAQPTETQVCDSSVGPDERLEYQFNTSFPGYWHYHDHSHTFNRDAEHGPLLGTEAALRGLWGAFRVLEKGDTPDHLLDLHVLDTGINGGVGLSPTITEGDRFDLIIAAIGHWDRFWDVWLTDPDGIQVDAVLVGDGLSRGITVLEASAGEYTWHAQLNSTYEAWRSGLDGLPTLDERPPPSHGTITVTAADGRASGAHLDTRPGGQPVQQGDRSYTIPFDYWSALADGLPLLEAYAGELLEFDVIRGDMFGHTFHLHGHTWEDPETGQFIDAAALLPGVRETHSFNVEAGLSGAYAGDWLYHCHINADDHMWSVLRVYPHSMAVEGPLDALRVEVANEAGYPVEGAQIAVRWDDDAPEDPTLSDAGDGVSIEASVEEVEPGHTSFGRIYPQRQRQASAG